MSAREDTEPAHKQCKVLLKFHNISVFSSLNQLQTNAFADSILCRNLKMNMVMS